MIHSIKQYHHAIGLYCTSLDGMGIASVTSDGYKIKALGAKEFFPYPHGLQQSLQTMANDPKHYAEQDQLIQALTAYHAQSLTNYLKHHEHTLEPIDVLGYEGITLFYHKDPIQYIDVGSVKPLFRILQNYQEKHAPSSHASIPIIYHFRKTDMDHGGLGGPITAIYYQSLLRNEKKPLAAFYVDDKIQVVLVYEDKIQAFDIGQGMALFKKILPSTWVPKNEATKNISTSPTINPITSPTINPTIHSSSIKDKKKAYLTQQSQPNKSNKILNDEETLMKPLINWMLDHPFLTTPPPKHLTIPPYIDNQNFALWETLTQHQIYTIANHLLVQSIILSAQKYFPSIHAWYISGTRRTCKDFMDLLQLYTPTPIVNIDSVVPLHIGKFLKTQAIAFLAIRHLLNLPTTFPSTTGVSKPLVAGEIYQ